jgi:hypothetical protein
MQGQRNIRVTDEQVNQIFSRNHAQEEADYYSPREPRITTTIEQLAEHMIGRGRARRVGACPQAD